MRTSTLLKRSALAAALVVATGLAHAAETKTFRWAYQGDAMSLDPMALNETFTLGFQNNIYEPLVAYDGELKLVPALATSWENPEPTKWVFKLRQGVKFHDGTPFNADDVIFSWKRSLTPGSDMKAYGAKAADIKKIDDYTIEVTTPTPNPILPREWVYLFIMSKPWSEKNKTTEATNAKGDNQGNFANLNSNGTGPFMVTSRQPDIRTTMKRFDGYWGKDKIATNVDEVIFQPITQEATRVAALISGEMDAVIPVPVQDWKRLEDAKGVKPLTGAEARAIFIGMDQSRDELLFSNIKGKNPFKDVRVREAVVLAVDTKAINDKIMRGAAKPLGSLVATAINGYADSYGAPIKPDVEKAKKLLVDAGYPQGFEVTMDCPNDRYVNDEKVCQAVASMLARVGIKINLLAQTKSKYFGKILPQAGNQTSMYMLGWTPSSIDAHNALLNLVTCRDPKTSAGQFNLGGYCNPKVDELTAKVGVETDQVKRNAMIKEAFEIVRTDWGYLPLHQQPMSWGVKDTIKVVQRADDVMDLRSVVMP
ncbi:ABC transporter substrate-binding protein [Alcaligenaceae bacterium A4P071]|uniref:ABC transporter substrate-binding protein n=1 Tax=Schauerella aestuarii TaxID=2511204 RepID=UPI00137162CE|nr:ABC transporter substrate-binding protein [Achromobacter aestuarii]MDQ2136660.1 ABC transporter substrate-binding protein [Alcaligenaceae bacterium B3P038]MDQ2151152.1 ABC transporter substrate-binding protein [Alcaligenaceae bacterium C4P045]MDQ2187491.1 ABC transporter substrate-binding protein [Alcaligenaceae bacterium A4P071]MYZ42415.1 ABC transporter substrate-binding protein [Achromobacter aestuarii]